MVRQRKSEADRENGLRQGICCRWKKDLSDRLQLLIEDGTIDGWKMK